jgi:predicted ATPase
VYLDRIKRKKVTQAAEEFPWTVQSLNSFNVLDFTTSVTFLVGDNGSGKSTLLEGLAYGMGAYAVGSNNSVASDPLLHHARLVAEAFYFERRSRPKTKMFLRAEDVYGFIKAEIAEASDLEAEASEIMASERPSATAANMLLDTARSIRQSDPDGRSHGETFLKILGSRLHTGGLYFLDEPETPLSPARQLSLLFLIQDLATGGAQFIIATHSPILLAMPGAAILQLDRHGITQTEYEDVENVSFMKAFLQRPELFLDTD